MQKEQDVLKEQESESESKRENCSFGEIEIVPKEAGIGYEAGDK